MKKFSTQARYSLDKRFQKMKPYIIFERPPKGWIRAIRDALGLTTAQLAKRMGIAQPTLHKYEANECANTITLNSLQKAAEAMNCQLIYALVPKDSLEGTMRRQAEAKTKHLLGHVQHTMQLEKQGLSKTDEADERKRFIQELMDDPRSLWED